MVLSKIPNSVDTTDRLTVNKTLQYHSVDTTDRLTVNKTLKIFGTKETVYTKRRQNSLGHIGRRPSYSLSPGPACSAPLRSSTGDLPCQVDRVRLNQVLPTVVVADFTNRFGVIGCLSIYSVYLDILQILLLIDLIILGMYRLWLNTDNTMAVCLYLCWLFLVTFQSHLEVVGNLTRKL